jgi:hypothetical protein
VIDRLRLTLLSLTAAFATLAFAPAAHAQFVGITSDDVFAGSPSYQASTLAQQRRVGVRLIRQTFSWKSIETRRGSYNFAAHDRYVGALATARVRVLPILFQSPSFYVRRRRGRAECQPRRNADFARFAQAMVARYGPNGTLWTEQPSLPKVPIRSWQIWNEPNLGIYWCGRASAKSYAAMLRTVGKAIKRSDRRAEVVTAGIAPSKLKSAVRLPKYLRQLYRARGASGFDTLAINSYARNRAELSRLLGSVRRLMNSRGDRRARIWITELGWGDRGVRHRFIVGRRGQARRISSSVRFIRRARGRLRLRGFVYYSWRDLRPYPPLFKNLWGLHTGLLNRQGRPKPAFNSFRRAVRGLR